MGLFSSLFPDPEKVKLERKQRIMQAVKRFEREVRTQEKFIRDYVGQAVTAQRCNDQAGYAQAKKMVAFSYSYRRRAQRGLNALRLFTSMADQMDAYRDFCSSMKDISKSIGNAFSTADMANIEQQFSQGMVKAESMQQMMDQLLDGFDSAVESGAPDDLEKMGVANDDIDALIGKLAEAGDASTESKVAEILGAQPAPKPPG